jgi:hypothetical protein
MAMWIWLSPTELQGPLPSIWAMALAHLPK